jgi:photosystem II stability/assembly factor-like uncharacterized protein
MCADDAGGLYLGSRVGSVFDSIDGGDTWQEIIANIPDVVVVRAAGV